MIKARICFLVIISFLVYPLGAIAEDTTPNWESFEYSGFKTIEKFTSFEVLLAGSAEKLGLKAEELTDLLKLKFKNTFAGMKVEKQPPWSEVLKAKTKFGFIGIKVSTVGDDYLVAHHVRILAGNYSDFHVYENEWLGFGPKEDLPSTIRQVISEAVEKLAIAFFKARGSM